MDFNAGSYDSSHAGSYPSPRVCIPERCFTKCTHCIEFNHPPQEEPVLSARVSTPLPGHAADALRECVQRKTIEKRSITEILEYQILSIFHHQYYSHSNWWLFSTKVSRIYYSLLNSLAVSLEIHMYFFSFLLLCFHIFDICNVFDVFFLFFICSLLSFLRDLLIIRRRVILTSKRTDSSFSGWFTVHGPRSFRVVRARSLRFVFQ